MSRAPFVVLGRLACIGAGFVLGGILLPIAEGAIRHGPVAPDRAKPLCAILNTGCWAATTYAYNDTTQPDCVVADYACLASSMMNFVWCCEYSGNQLPIFVNVGHVGLLEAHLASLYQAVNLPGVKTIVYTNAPGGLGNFVDPGPTLAAITVLERVRREFPETEADVAAYLRCLYDSVGYERALAELGEDWHDLIDPETFELPPATAKLQVQAIRKKRRIPAPIRRLSAMVKTQLEGEAAAISIVRTFLCDWLDTLLPPTATHRSRRVKNSSTILSLLEKCSAHYLDPVNRKPLRHLMKTEDFWASVGGATAWNAWVNITAKVCRSRGISLVYYIPPHLNVSAREYADSFGPGYVDVVKRSFAPFDNVVVIDRSLDHTLKLPDALWWTVRNVSFNYGFLFNAIGRLKSARLLVESLLAVKRIGDGGELPQFMGTAWRGERALPSETYDVEYLSECDAKRVQDRVLEEDSRVRSQSTADFRRRKAAPSGPSILER